ncbi:MAG: ornithine--oxo-acid transaminase [Phycisphaerales bacterium]|nr:ornithine--oxo-acid transaminase [Phycisphaerales bacterium]
MTTAEHTKIVDKFGAHNYGPLPVVIKKGEGCWVEDVEGRRYLDMLGGYSALNFGHCHPYITQVFIEQAQKLTLTARAFQNDQFGLFCKEITEFCGFDKVLPMNSGAEAVETAVKTARKWAYKVKGVPEDKAEIIVCDHNFHGRTTTVISFSSSTQARDGFGPFTPGFKSIPYADTDALEKAITPNTAAFLVEPIQGEGGIQVPPDGYLRKCLEICKANNVLLIDDEIQAGFGRPGKKFAIDFDGVHPDMMILGKALGGGTMPVSAVLGSDEIMGVFKPGDHGSTFGGNPLACAVARAAIKVLQDEHLIERSAELGPAFMQRIMALNSPAIKEVRGRGLWIGIEIDPKAGSAHDYVLKLLDEGILTKETLESVLRLAPPLIITQEEIDWAMERIAKVFAP